jgi:glutaconyl-CoA/methylmalonyl-CoA decarboxylase subunit gamma
MRKYNVNVNGTAYEVTVEEVTGAAASAPVAAPAAPAAAPAPVAAAPAGAGTEVTAPMPGNVLSVNVTVGQHVEAGSAVVVLEAMKMENEIPAPISGTVTSVAVTKGATVAGGAVLCTIA